MPHQSSPACDRVTPFGKIESFLPRDTFTGNRGMQHSGREIVRSRAHDPWVIHELKRSLVR